MVKFITTFVGICTYNLVYTYTIGQPKYEFSFQQCIKQYSYKLNLSLHFVQGFHIIKRKDDGLVFLQLTQE